MPHESRRLWSWLIFDVGRKMNRFLFVFGYESPQERHANDRGADFESSNAVWVRAGSEDEAITRGRAYADDFVAKLYREEKMPDSPRWSDQKWAHWISQNPAKEFADADLQSLEEV